jgi:tRNA U55 pseudouridine synthase TruB
LTRTRVGPFSLDESISLDVLAERGVDAFIQPASRAMPDAPSFSADGAELARLANGQAVAVDGLRADAVWVYDPGGRLMCLASADGIHLRPRLLL